MTVVGHCRLAVIRRWVSCLWSCCCCKLSSQRCWNKDTHVSGSRRWSECGVSWLHGYSTFALTCLATCLSTRYHHYCTS